MISQSSYTSFSFYPHRRCLLFFPTRRSSDLGHRRIGIGADQIASSRRRVAIGGLERDRLGPRPVVGVGQPDRSEEHTSELQSRENIVCRLQLETKKT